MNNRYLCLGVMLTGKEVLRGPARRGRQECREWSEEDDELLKKIYPKGKREDICRIFGRSWNTIRAHARRQLKLMRLVKG